MDHKFTELLKTWLETPESERDYSVGALYLLQLSGNKIMYRNVVAQLDRQHQFVEYQLQKYYNFRVQALTHKQVEEMAEQVEVIAKEHSLTEKQSDESEPKQLGSATTTILCPTILRRSSWRTFRFSKRCANCIFDFVLCRLKTRLAPIASVIRSLKNL